MSWGYRRIRSYRIGKWRVGYELRSYTLEVPASVAWPRLWRVEGEGR